MATREDRIFRVRSSLEAHLFYFIEGKDVSFVCFYFFARLFFGSFVQYGELWGIWALFAGSACFFAVL